ncbi:hypothetical protein SCLCIDRAFT_980063 [Scleroderma citrinum Foug A]|uniref:Uncharacterized protein n=1 Tax=Scleroderma citrinum Foug A TaxID=1036808 RepID=A0A0C3DGV8_9AGAM|nr:hypothetical protein SCLCIDRAFT_980063 [Scleroderma citrinum Foug A]
MSHLNAQGNHMYNTMSGERQPHQSLVVAAPHYSPRSGNYTQDIYTTCPRIASNGTVAQALASDMVSRSQMAKGFQRLVDAAWIACFGIPPLAEIPLLAERHEVTPLTPEELCKEKTLEKLRKEKDAEWQEIKKMLLGRTKNINLLAAIAIPAFATFLVISPSGDLAPAMNWYHPGAYTCMWAGCCSCVISAQSGVVDHSLLRPTSACYHSNYCLAHARHFFCYC